VLYDGCAGGSTEAAAVSYAQAAAVAAVSCAGGSTERAAVSTSARRCSAIRTTEAPTKGGAKGGGVGGSEVRGVSARRVRAQGKRATKPYTSTHSLSVPLRPSSAARLEG
jgi:hypothetical protein